VDRRRPALSLRDPTVFRREQRPRWPERMDELTGEALVDSGDAIRSSSATD
jgi:phage gpG-like protein